MKTIFRNPLAPFNVLRAGPRSGRRRRTFLVLVLLSFITVLFHVCSLHHYRRDWRLHVIANMDLITNNITTHINNNSEVPKGNFSVATKRSDDVSTTNYDDVSKATDVIEWSRDVRRKYKTILLWRKFHSKSSEWRHIFSRQERGDCGEQVCRLVYDPKYTATADAIVMTSSVRRFPNFRTPSQRWVLFSVEPPTQDEWNFSAIRKKLFNWTMSYHRRADVVTPFGRVVPIHSTEHGGGVFNHERDYWAEKDESRLAVWMASHCSTSSRREDYVAALRRVIHVDVYGACGNMSCGTRNIVANIQKSKSFCKKESSYMFYLAFENSICDDYVTEKFYKALRMDVVPVVLGGANYSALAPPNSFINALDFATPEKLGKYLLHVAGNRSLYNSFFAWKEKFAVDLGFPFNPLVCDLCRKLHQSDRNDVSSYADVGSWFKDVSMCHVWNSTRTELQPILL